MRRGLFPTRSIPKWLVASTLLAAGIVGCNRDAYDPALTYPVRTDWIVATGAWDIQPVRFTLPGYLPLDMLRHTLKLLPADLKAESAKERTKEVREVGPDQFALREQIGKRLFDPTKLSAETRKEYGTQLEAMFGTPLKPKVSGLNADALKAVDESLTAETVLKTLQLGDDRLALGSKLYRSQCLHCHGLEGNGRGPTGFWVNPQPRDYRQGIFKFTSTSLDQGVRKPRRADLMRILTTGIEGTSMPSFGLLSETEREAIVSYVIHLSLRGEAEYQTMFDQLKDENQKFTMNLRDEAIKNPTVKDALEDNLALAASRWINSQKPDAAITPTAYPYANDDAGFMQSAARGAKVFLGAGGCIACHQNYGRESNLVYDAWGTIVRGRNLYDGVYRGGRRPLDLYYRIHSGINGAGMTAYKDIKSQLKPDDVGLPADQFEKSDPLWDMVNFLRALGYPELRQKLRDEFKINLPE